MNSDYNIEDDEYYKNHISKPSINEDTAKKYKKILRKFCRATDKTLDEIITSCIDEQNIITTIDLPPDPNGNQRKREIRFNVNNKDAAIKQYINQYREYCKKRNNKNSTINREIGDIKAFLRGAGVILPKIENLEDDTDDWNLLTKEDFNFILQDMNIVHAGLLNFLSSSGMRISDALSQSIGDFMDATSEYHDFVDVEEFIDNAPDDMIGQWDFEPQKTKKHHIKCITFNSTHTSNLILQNLRRIKNQYLPDKNKKDGTNIKISKHDALFGSRLTKYKEPIRAKTVADQWYKKNKKFKEWKINQIEQKIKNGELSAEDYDKAIEEIPKFHAHGCRKFFISTVAEHCGNIRVSALLEGHSGGLKTDKSYVKKSAKEIKDIYVNDIHDALCLSKVETRIVSNKETEEMNKKISESNAKVETLTNELNEKDRQIALLQEQVENQSEQMKETSEILNQIKNQTDKNYIRERIKQHFRDNQRIGIIQRSNTSDDILKCIAIEDLAYQYALKEGFEDSKESIETYIKKAIIQCNLHPEIIEEMHEKGTSYDREMTENMQIVLLFDKFYEYLKTQEDIWEMIDDEDKLKNIFFKNISTSNYNVSEISSEDMNKISEDILMEYIG